MPRHRINRREQEALVGVVVLMMAAIGVCLWFLLRLTWKGLRPAFAWLWKPLSRLVPIRKGFLGSRDYLKEQPGEMRRLIDDGALFFCGDCRSIWRPRDREDSLFCPECQCIRVKVATVWNVFDSDSIVSGIKEGLGMIFRFAWAPLGWLFSIKDDFLSNEKASSSPLAMTAKLFIFIGLFSAAGIYAVSGPAKTDPKPTMNRLSAVAAQAEPKPTAEAQPVETPEVVIAPKLESAEKDTYEVVRVVDGDTVVIKIDGADVKVRLIGLDTPETVHPSKPVERFGKEASEFAKQLLEGQSVTLEYEPGSTLDKYNRTLAYLRLKDGRDVNREMIAKGYGHAYVKYPFRRMDDYRKAEREAREANLGLWGPEVVATVEEALAKTVIEAPKAVTVYATATGSKYHSKGCRYLAKSSIPMMLADAASKLGQCSVCHPPAYQAIAEGPAEATSVEAPLVDPSPPPVVSSSATGTCGARTQKGTPCKRKVKGGGHCYQHGG